MASENLLRHHRIGEPAVGEDTLDHRCQETHVIVGALALLFVVGTMGDIAL